MHHINKLELVKFLNEKIKNTKCPLCEKDDWTISEHLYGLVNLDIGNGAICNSIIPIVCRECGNTILLQADKTGALIDDKEESNDSE
ncbi:hypothetical protein DW886_15000 [Enterocloster aldenensis]|uniref:hypothetical protein n=1 Tax=Enterocloster aldenensis TaxID=358742 RepID=UPI000E5395FD|nr:hypothetical protein DW886_15000 [Enterocloster aldenensis]